MSKERKIHKIDTYFGNDGSELIGKRPIWSVHGAPLFVEVIPDKEGLITITLGAVADTLPSWLYTNERHQHNLESAWKPRQIAQDTKKADLVQTKTADMFQDLIHGERHSCTSKKIQVKMS